MWGSVHGLANPSHTSREKRAPQLGGWHGFLTATFGAELLDPAIANWLTANCEKARPGWPCDAKLEELRVQFARELDPIKQKDVAQQIQARARHVTPYVPLGQWYSLTVARTNIRGLLVAPTIVFGTSKKAHPGDVLGLSGGCVDFIVPINLAVAS